MEKRENIDPKYKWDLSCYLDEDKIEEEFEYIEKTYPTFVKYNKKFDDKELLLEYLNVSKEFNIRVGRLEGYIFHTYNTDTSNTKFIKLTQRFSFLANEINQILSFVEPQLIKLKTEYLNELLKDDRFKDNYRFFNSIIRSKKHKVDEKTTKLLSKMGLFLDSPSECYDELTTSEVQFEEIEFGGQKYVVNDEVYQKLINSKDRELRKVVHQSFMNSYGKNNKTITAFYLNQCNKDNFFAHLEKFKSAKSQAFFYEEVDEKVYSILIKQLHERIPLLNELLEERRKFLNYDKLYIYDLSFDLTESKEYTIEEAQKLVKECTKILGEEYSKLVEEKFNQQVIDYLPNKDKYTGGYSSDSYGCPSIVLMNFVGEYSSVATLAHEMGHAIHSELSNKYQPYETADYVIFVAEVASTVNELLLLSKVTAEASGNQKKALILKLFYQLYHSAFDATILAEFEEWVHSELDNKKPKTYDDLNKYYLELIEKYIGEKVEIPNHSKYKWTLYNHFYRAFYLYKYAIGFISALCIVQKLMTEKDYYKKYINFLKSGSSKDPVSLLKDIDVDLTTSNPYNIAFDYIRKQLEEFKNV